MEVRIQHRFNIIFSFLYIYKTFFVFLSVLYATWKCSTKSNHILQSISIIHHGCKHVIIFFISIKTMWYFLENNFTIVNNSKHYIPMPSPRHILYMGMYVSVSMCVFTFVTYDIVKDILYHHRIFCMSVYVSKCMCLYVRYEWHSMQHLYQDNDDDIFCIWMCVFVRSLCMT